MAYNYYQGNVGKSQRIEEKPRQPQPQPVKSQAAPVRESAKGDGGLASTLSRLLPNKLGELETEDFILLLILYLMYRESGDSELLMIMGAMFLL